MWSVVGDGFQISVSDVSAGEACFCVFQDMYYASVKALYTVGYSTSLVSLTIAMVILCRFR